ncbi:hypothetical protein ACJMK2_032442 [Sinanodonta woodiana]|uniref:Apyrase n=1 Tax=Sinanodonta woodiana TaxID=1069815 RepID=A0ABD3X5A4_SINWO
MDVKVVISVYILHFINEHAYGASLEPYRNYGIIVDAGSSSTKVRIYSWSEVPNKNIIPLIAEIPNQKKFEPGISAFETEIGGVFNYTFSILEYINDSIPEEKRKTTRLHFMATAGLRLLNQNVTKVLLDEVHTTLLNKDINPFSYQTGGRQAAILSGEEEAMFAWVTVNYVLGTFEQQRPDINSVGLVELGGGSLQIAFVPEDPIYAGKLSFQIAGRDYSIYGHSFLSYGATSVAERVVDYLVRNNPYATEIMNPCMLRGDSINMSSDGKKLGLVGSGNATLCEEILSFYLQPAPKYMCSPKPCSIGQIYQPPIKDRKFFTAGLINFLVKTFDAMDEEGKINLTHLQAEARSYCSMTLDEALKYMSTSASWASRNCQDGLYIPLVFSALGFTMDTNSLRAVDTVKGVKIAWGLGAMLIEEEKTRFYREELNAIDVTHPTTSEKTDHFINHEGLHIEDVTPLLTSDKTEDVLNH